MTKAEKILSKECNRYINGECMTAACLLRGGWKRGAKRENNNMATCEIHEAILEIRKLEDAKNHMDACRSLLNTPDDEVLYQDILKYLDS